MIDKIEAIKTKFVLVLEDLFESQKGKVKIEKGDGGGNEEILEVSVTMDDTCGGEVTAGIAGDFNHKSYGKSWNENTMIIAIAKAAFNEIIQRKEGPEEGVTLISREEYDRLNPEEENNND